MIPRNLASPPVAIRSQFVSSSAARPWPHMVFGSGTLRLVSLRGQVLENGIWGTEPALRKSSELMLLLPRRGGFNSIPSMKVEDSDGSLDYHEVVHVFIRRQRSNCGSSSANGSGATIRQLGYRPLHASLNRQRANISEKVVKDQSGAKQPSQPGLPGCRIQREVAHPHHGVPDPGGQDVSVSHDRLLRRHDRQLIAQCATRR